MPAFLAPIINDQQVDANGNPLSGGKIFVYLAGSSTPVTTYSDKAGLVPNTNPLTLNTLGVNSQGAVWLTGGVAYKYVIQNAALVTQRTIDNVSGIGDTTVTTDQWVVYSATPTYVSPTAFSVAGDQTQIFQKGRRVRTQNTGGLVYSTIASSVYGAPNTTVTLSNDSGVLDAGLSAVSYGLISVISSSLSGIFLGIQVFAASGTYTPTPGATRALVRAIGGGGAGGGAPATGVGQIGLGLGGAAGGYGELYITSGLTVTAVTIGVGGVPVTGAAGGTGGTTSFGALMLCGGGTGGAAAGPSVPPIVLAGQAGGGVITGTGNIIVRATGGVASSNAIGLGTAAFQFFSSAGANSMWGEGGGGQGSTTAGFAAPGKGSGGGGGATGVSAAAVPGGFGADGYLIVEEFA